MQHFNKHLQSRILEFVEEELQPHFGSLMTFVRELEQIDDQLDRIEAGI